MHAADPVQPPSDGSARVISAEPAVAGRMSSVGLGLCRLPATLTFLFTLTLTTVLRHRLPDDLTNRLVRASSTNLHNLARRPVQVLGMSAAWSDGGIVDLVVAGLVLALAEWRLGTRRMVGGFLVGHIGATVVVAAGLALGMWVGWVDGRVSNAVDVGVSYGLMALLAVLALGCRAGWRRSLAAASIVVSLGSGLLGGINFTTIGHVVAVLLGACAALLVVTPRSIGRWSCPRSSPCASTASAGGPADGRPTGPILGAREAQPGRSGDHFRSLRSGDHLRSDDVDVEADHVGRRSQSGGQIYRDRMAITGRDSEDEPGRAVAGEPCIGGVRHEVEVDAGRADHDHALA